MTSDIRSLINECPSASERREARKRLRREAARRKKRADYKREINYLRGLGSSINALRLKLSWLKLIRAAGLKIEKLETKLKKRRAKRASVTKAVESGWHNAWRDQVKPYQKNRFYWLGVTAYRNGFKHGFRKHCRKRYRKHCRNDYNPTRIPSKASYFMLWDDWEGKPPLGFFHQQPRDEPPQTEIEIEHYAALLDD
jgi:Fe-S oxidoreductase